MAFELKEGQFTLHKQDPAKKKKESSPDFFGSARVSAEDLAKLNANPLLELHISGWGKMSNDGKPYISGYISLPQETQSAPAEVVDSFMVTEKMAAAKQEAVRDEPENNDLPF